jgi:hypothetical protein
VRGNLCLTKLSKAYCRECCACLEPSRQDAERAYPNVSPPRIQSLSSGFAFITFEDPRDGDDAIKDMSGKEILGCPIRIEESRGKGGGKGDRGGELRARVLSKTALNVHHILVSYVQAATAMAAAVAAAATVETAAAATAAIAAAATAAAATVRQVKLVVTHSAASAIISPLHPSSDRRGRWRQGRRRRQRRMC